MIVIVLALMLVNNIAEAKGLLNHINIWYGNFSKLPYDDEASADVIATFNGAVMGRLFSIDENLQLKPDKLESFSYDQTSYTYTLRIPKGLKFHNGREVSSSDLEFSIIRGIFSTKRNFYKLYLNEVIGIDSVLNEKVFRSGMVRGIRLEDKHTLKIALKHNNPNFIYMFCKGYFGLVPIEEFHLDYVTWKRYPIGIGPYRVKEVNLQQGYVELVDNNSVPKFAPRSIRFWQKRPKNEVMHIVPSTVFPVDGLDEKNFKKYIYQLPDAVGLFTFNVVHPLAKDLNFRKFLYYGLDRKKLSEKLEGSRPTYENIPEILGGGSVQFPANAFALAQEYLKKIPQLMLGAELNILIFGKKPEKITDKFKLEMKRQLEQFGLKISFLFTEEKFPSKETSALSPIFFFYKIADFFEPKFLFVSMLKESPYVNQRCGDPKMDELYQKINAETDRKEKYRLLREISAYSAKNVYENPLVETKAIIAYDQSVIESLGNQMEPLSVRFEKIVLAK